MKTQNFHDLQVWQKSMNLAQSVYRITGEFPKSETYGLSSQMRRAAVSVPSNIAEGHGQGTDRQFANSLCHARGSLYELHTQIELAGALDCIGAKGTSGLIEECTGIARVLNALLRTLKTS